MGLAEHASTPCLATVVTAQRHAWCICRLVHKALLVLDPLSPVACYSHQVEND
jgi:hypothetical protein